MVTLTILRGISGSGKSTWARNQNALVVSRDTLREAYFPNFTSEEYYKSPNLRDMEESITRIQDATIASLLRDGKDVIVDNTNIEWKYVTALAKIAYRCWAEVEVKVFDVPLADAIARDSVRGMTGGRRVGKDIITKQHQRFQGNKNKALEGIAPVKPYNGTPGAPKAFLVDVDGTLAHMRNLRGPFDWKKVGLDEPDLVIMDLATRLHNSTRWGDDGLEVIVMSGRDESCRQETFDWMVSWDFNFNHMFMRPAGDMRPDNIVKAELFDTRVRDNFDVQFVLDDRDQVVDMWRRMGLTCLQVAEGNF